MWAHICVCTPRAGQQDLLANQYLCSHCKCTTWKWKGNYILSVDVLILESLVGFWVCLSQFQCRSCPYRHPWVWKKEEFLQRICNAKSEDSLQGAGLTLFRKYLSTLAFSLFADQIPHLQARGKQWSRGGLVFYSGIAWKSTTEELITICCIFWFILSLCWFYLFAWDFCVGFVLRFFKKWKITPAAD